MNVKYALQKEKYKKQSLEILLLSEEFVKKKLPILKSVFDADFWNRIRNQLKTLLEGNGKIIHPVFRILEKDIHNNFSKIKQLDNYLYTIFEVISNKKKNYIKKELSSFDGINSLNTLYEINVLGYLLGQFSIDKIQVYPKTIGRNNVDVKINLCGRGVYIDITVLGTSHFTRENMENITQVSRFSRSGKSGFYSPSEREKDKRRIISTLQGKEKQFIPKKPNVLVLFISSDDSYLVISPSLLLKEAIKQNPPKNIGLIMGFDPQKLLELYEDGCDNKCFLVEDEKKYIKDLFSCGKFETLTYNSIVRNFTRVLGTGD